MQTLRAWWMELGLWELHYLEHVLPSKVEERGDEAPSFNRLSSERAPIISTSGPWA